MDFFFPKARHNALSMKDICKPGKKWAKKEGSLIILAPFQDSTYDALKMLPT